MSEQVAGKQAAGLFCHVFWVLCYFGWYLVRKWNLTTGYHLGNQIKWLKLSIPFLDKMSFKICFTFSNTKHDILSRFQKQNMTFCHVFKHKTWHFVMFSNSNPDNMSSFKFKIMTNCHVLNLKNVTICQVCILRCHVSKIFVRILVKHDKWTCSKMIYFCAFTFLIFCVKCSFFQHIKKEKKSRGVYLIKNVNVTFFLVRLFFSKKTEILYFPKHSTIFIPGKYNLHIIISASFVKKFFRSRQKKIHAKNTFVMFFL
jgi:hypothetical protein